MAAIRFRIVIFLLYATQLTNGKGRKKLDVIDHHGNDVTRQIEKFLRDHSYELSLRPPTKGALPVDISLNIESISDISEKNMDLTFTLCMHESWTDERLRFKSSEPVSSIVLPSRLVEKLWVPDIYTVGSKNSFVHKTTVNNIVLRLFRDGRIRYKVKMTTTVSCQMTLYNFPLDLESCSLIFRSLGYSNEELVLHWSMGETMEELFMDTKMVTNMPKFRLVHHFFDAANITVDSHSNDQTTPVSHGEKVSELRIRFELKRYLLSCLFQSYFPAMIMVVLAGLGMWIDPSSVPARVSLGVTSVLTISTVITGLKGSLPKVSYLTAMDIYLWVCFLFVFSTVLEFCVLNFFMTKRGKKFLDKMIERRKRRIIKRKSRFASRIPTNIGDSEKSDTRNQKNIRNVFRSNASVTSSLYSDVTDRHFPPSNELLMPKFCCKGFEATSVDACFRIWYFLTFIVFNAVYWTYYVIVTQHHGDAQSDLED
uniref:Gamma-aminobutyric acid receptor subunit rho-2 n=1 Tax=Phallusia mammillata TaxID=59560 RepID=A0A6F9DDZ0_9ASCI|nr:gamma-aminobutyric acid receptor subunit rho-2 [Phallusia mammillata]